jgi:hypothetical protein
MFVVDMDPQPPFAPYPNVRIGPVYTYPPESLTTADPGTWTVNNLSISPSGRYVDVKFGSPDDCGSYDMHRIFEVDPATLALKPHNMATGSLRCCTFQGRPNGWIFPLKHADMTLDPFDDNEDVIVGGRSCPGATIGHVVKVRLRDGQLTPLTDGVNESSVYHVSTRNLDRPGWAYVSWFKVDGSRYSDEITAIKLDGSGSVERLCHMHTAASGCYRCEAHPVPSRDGARVIFASNWDEDCGAGCGSSTDIKDYVVIDTAAIATNQPRIQHWPSDSTSNLPVCAAANLQNNAQMASDGAGGAYVVWEDNRAGTSRGTHVYAQHLLATGGIAPGWPVDGAAICSTGTGQSKPAVVADRNGGAMFVWFDSRGPGNLYAQRVSADGVPAWADGGITLGSETRGSPANTGGPPSLLSDGAGGAFVVWNDTRTPGAGVYIQYVTQSGTLMWNDPALAVITRAGGQSSARITSDDAGGMYIVWKDSRAGNADIYAQHLSGIGTLLWQADGIPVCTAGGNQVLPFIADDRIGGAYVGWQDFRTDSSGDAYLQHLVTTGTDPLWPHDGLALAPSQSSGASQPFIIPDSQGGALCSWTDSRVGTMVFVQRVNHSGATQWSAGGVPVTPNASYLDAAVGDDANGLIVLYEQRHPQIPADLRAQRVTGQGAPMWGAGGVAVAYAPRNQNNAVAVPDGAHGAIFAWHDARSDTGDVYAQNVKPDGALGGPVVPVLISLVSVDQVGSSVALKWFSGQGALVAATVYRTTDGNSWSALGNISTDASGIWRFEDQTVVAGESYGYRLGVQAGSGEEEFSAVTWVAVPQDAALSLGPWANPVVTDATLRFALPAPGRAQLELLDLQGRVVETLLDENLAAGEHLVQWSPAHAKGPIGSGVYVARLKIGGKRITRRLIVIK